MKSLILMMVIWVMIVQSPVWAVLTYELDLEGTTEEQYSIFLEHIRDDVKDSDLIYGGTDIPVIGAALDPKFLRVDLKVTTGKTVSLAVRRSNLYVQAYLAKNEDEKFKVYYFRRKITTDELNELFEEAEGRENHHEIEYKDSYPEIEFYAKITRKKVGLGIKKLAAFTDDVNEMKYVKRKQARFILLAATMVSEAVRFKYIEELVRESINDNIETPDRVIILENNWSVLSKATKASNDGVFIRPLVLESYAVVGTDWTVDSVEDVNLGILLNIPNTHFVQNKSEFVERF